VKIEKLCPVCRSYVVVHEVTEEELADGYADVVCPVPDCGQAFEIQVVGIIATGAVLQFDGETVSSVAEIARKAGKAGGRGPKKGGER
jgi:hypothetical protein